MKDDTANIIDSFEYQAEKAKQDFQTYVNALLEAHSDFLYKISTAKGSKKTGIWIELSEAEIISGHILECISNVMGSYEIINKTNKLLNINYRAAQAVARKDIRSSIDDFRNDRITKEQFSERITDFVGIRKPVMKASC